MENVQSFGMEHGLAFALALLLACAFAFGLPFGAITRLRRQQITFPRYTAASRQPRCSSPLGVKWLRDK